VTRSVDTSALLLKYLHYHQSGVVLMIALRSYFNFWKTQMLIANSIMASIVVLVTDLLLSPIFEIENRDKKRKNSDKKRGNEILLLRNKIKCLIRYSGNNFSLFQNYYIRKSNENIFQIAHLQITNNSSMIPTHS
jgi:hypothetical protein